MLHGEGAEIPPHFLLSHYDYRLPEHLIAQEPLPLRDASRMLVIHRKERRIEHRYFRDLPEYLDASDLLVANNTRVIQARLLGKRPTGGKIEFLLLEKTGDLRWEGMFHAAAKHKPGVTFEIPTPDGKGLRGTLVRGASDSPHGTVEAEFDRDPIESGAGEVPLPPYIHRPEALTDRERYQTVFAKNPGSAAAPTAGLHFTPEVMARLHDQGVGWTEVTLQVGLGTFRPVKDEDVRLHTMHEEAFHIPAAAALQVNDAKHTGKRVMAVGTTVVRTLEAGWDISSRALREGAGRTDLFIVPDVFEFQVVDRMLTNFHLPKSTLLMLVCAFGGHELVMEAYRQAVDQGYRFFSYGDAMLVL